MIDLAYRSRISKAALVRNDHLFDKTIVVMGNGRSRSSGSQNQAFNNCIENDSRKMNEKCYVHPSYHKLHHDGFFRVELALIDASNEANNDPQAIGLLHNLKCGIWETACNANTYSKQPFVASTEEAKDVQKRVSRYLKTNDKYMAFASMLFKSRYFHEIHSKLSGESDSNRRHSVVELPTTEYRKPYIPLPNGWRNKSNHSAKEEDVFSFSVSHQFPFVGIARMHHNDQSSAGKSIAIVGLDIVVFEKMNPRLYSTEEEFLEMFRDQFTPNEWKRSIKNAQLGSSEQMKEFYVRWAMKEAYTKAIGVGMGLDFKSFEIHLEGNDGENFFSGASVWDHIRKHEESMVDKNQPLCFRGTIVFTNEYENEYFYFYFLPMASQETNPGSDDTMNGCACVCVGSFLEWNSIDSGDETKWQTNIDNSWTDLEGLLQSHRGTWVKGSDI